MATHGYHPVPCRGCGALLDPAIYEEGLCDECKETSYRKNAEAWRAGH